MLFPTLYGEAIDVNALPEEATNVDAIQETQLNVREVPS